MKRFLYYTVCTLAILMFFFLFGGLWIIMKELCNIPKHDFWGSLGPSIIVPIVGWKLIGFIRKKFNY